jgi:LysR family hydrogen peroxide-inducible transcriptional activator
MAITPTARDLSLRQLEYVVAVADVLGFHKAARRCHVSQPTLSAQIQQIESALGVQIFERNRRRVLVTTAGSEVVTGARRVLAEVQGIITAASGARDPFQGTFRIGVIPTIAPYLLPEVVPSVMARYPRLRLVFREEKTDDVVRELREGRLDAGLVALEADLGECAQAAIARDPFVVALPKGHPLGRKRKISLADLDRVRILLLDDGHCFRAQALAVCSKAGAEEADFRATSLATLVQMVSGGGAVTLLPALAVPIENRRAQLEVRPFAGEGPSRTLGLVWRPGSGLAAAFRELAYVLSKAVS